MGITQIELLDTYVPIRTVFEKPNPNFKYDEPLSIWKAFSKARNGPKTTAATMQQGGRYRVRVRMNLSSDEVEAIKDKLDDWEVRLIGTPTISGNRFSSDFMSDYFDIERVDSSGIDVAANCYSEMPCGISENIAWVLSAKQETFDLGATELELYALPVSLPPYYKHDGVPLDLLRLFILPVLRRDDIRNIHDWVAWAVKRCHASTRDKDCAVPMNERIHDYVYETYSGLFLYAGGNVGGDWDGDAWLSGRNERGAHHMTNCYDMASLVQAVVSLGTGGHVSEADASQNKVSWFYKRWFGFIHKTDLIGWGFTNSPFFLSKAYEGKKVFEGAELDSKLRSSFGNHAFVRYINESGEEVVLDACAGPSIGHSLKDYITTAIDNDNDRSFKRYNTAEDPYVYQGAKIFQGVTGINSVRRDVYYDADASRAKYKLALNEVLWEEYAERATPHLATLKSISWGPDIVRKMDFLGLLHDIKDIATAHYKGHSSLKFKVARPYAHFSDMQQVGLDLYVDSEAEEVRKSDFSALVKMLPSTELALREASIFFASNPFDDEGIRQQLKGAQDGTKPLIVHGDEGLFSTDIIMFGNVLIFLTKSTKTYENNAIAKEVSQRLVENQASLLDIKDSDIVLDQETTSYDKMDVHVKLQDVTVFMDGENNKVYDVTKSPDATTRTLRIKEWKIKDKDTGKIPKHAAEEVIVIKITNKKTLLTQFETRKVTLKSPSDGKPASA